MLNIHLSLYMMKILLISSSGARNYDRKTKMKITEQEKIKIWKETIELI